jgi:hypothetical protein
MFTIKMICQDFLDSVLPSILRRRRQRNRRIFYPAEWKAEEGLRGKGLAG